jgi:hypothetical protein
VKNAILITAATILAVTIALYLVVTSPQRELDRFLNQVAHVEVGKTKLEEWRKQLEQMHLSNWSVSCEQQTCGVGWRGDNTTLYRLRLAPKSTVAAEVGFKDGIASEINVWAEIDGSPDAAGVMQPGTGATVHQAATRGTCSQHYSTYTKQSGRHYWRVVTMDLCVLPEDRMKALAINSGCLTRLGGCKTAEAILPQVLSSP